MTFIESDLNEEVKFQESGEPESKYSNIHFIDLYDCNIPIVYGDERKVKNLTYYYVYAQLQKQEKKIQIGVYEFLSKKLVNYLSQNGKHLNIRQNLFPKPLLFPFATKKYFEKLKKKTYKLALKNVEKEEEVEETNVEKTKVEKTKVEKKEIQTNVVKKNFDNYDGVDKELFVKISGILTIADLAEETSEISKSIQNNYSFKKGQFWLQTLMKNNHYTLLDNEGGGDCLFACIRDAFGSIGLQTTVIKLRRKLSKEISQGKLEDYASKYEFYHHENSVLAEKIKNLESKYETTQQLFEETQDFENKKKLLALSKTIFLEREKLINKKKICVEIFKSFDFMKSVDTLEKLQKKMQSCSFWANPWVLSILERILNIKFIVLDHDPFQNRDFGSVFVSGEIDTIVKHRNSFEPDFYLLLEKKISKDYKLISYKNKQIFHYSELPFDLRDLIRKTCLTHSEKCLFCDIKHFQHFCKQDKHFGIQRSKMQQRKQQEAFSDSAVRNLFDENIIFVIQEKGNKNNILPGKAFNEKIKDEEIMQFYDLVKYPDWRNKLHDSFCDTQLPFQLDGHFWNSITHYLCANKFKETEKDYYLFFCAESTTPLSKNPKLAIAAASKSGIYKGKVIRPPNIKLKKPSISFKQLHNDALMAKFKQNEEFKKILLATQKAKLITQKNKIFTLANVLMMVRSLI